MQVTRASIRSGLAPFCASGGVFEIRMPGTRKGTVSGYFDDLDMATVAVEKAIRQFAAQSNAYVTMNPIRPECLARGKNQFVPRAKVTTADDDILRRRYLLLDFDPTRPKGIPSTNQELERALAVRDEVVAFLSTKGWPMPIEAMSGNGGHAVYAIDLPNDEKARELVKACLLALAGTFNTQDAAIDTGVYNAARLVKLYGTFARKGDDSPERPHRLARIDAHPPVLEAVPSEQLQELGREVLRGSRTSPTTSRHANPSRSLRAEFERRDLYLRPLDDGKHAVKCPWHQEHSVDSGESETVIFEPRDGIEGWNFKCQHDHCASRTARDVWAAFENPARERAAPTAGPVSFPMALASLAQSRQPHDAHRLPFGIDMFDQATQGVERGEVVIELGRTASLKSMYQQQHLGYLLKKKPLVAFLLVTMEMPLQQCLWRMLRQEYGLPDAALDSALRGNVLDPGLETLGERHPNLYFLDEGAISLGAIEQHALDLMGRLGKVRLEAIFIDHAGLIRPERPGSAYERASEIAIGLKQLARRLDLVVFCIVQANRAAAKSDGEPVDLETARDSGCFEENADFVIAFSNMSEVGGQTPYVRLRLAKNRRGPCAPAVLQFDRVTLRLTEHYEKADDD